jgi:hypothetical protein
MNVFKDFENRIKQAVQALDAVQEKGGEVSFERLLSSRPAIPHMATSRPMRPWSLPSRWA